ncbi:hypothetical protein ABI_25980 [Asticcacaulis biprosthecium C19]|uniref:Uncharacterized protein n=1 Tax=Asticcacaulis biprosthecium C19 TaxID=715226 RepID=F4QPC5_9CAUL|nr:hypothetical protein ABI_25980 [Asticcacaulis biprosthecium C19]
MILPSSEGDLQAGAGQKLGQSGTDIQAALHRAGLDALERAGGSDDLDAGLAGELRDGANRVGGGDVEALGLGHGAGSQNQPDQGGPGEQHRLVTTVAYRLHLFLSCSRPLSFCADFWKPRRMGCEISSMRLTKKY